MIRTKTKKAVYTFAREEINDPEKEKQCEVKPLGKFGIDFNKYLGCSWCSVKRECANNVLKGEKKWMKVKK